MESFLIRARSTSGELVLESIEAHSLKEAKKKLFDRGLIPLDVQTKARPFFGLPRGKKVRPADFLTFNRQFQIVYGVGVPLVRGLDLIEKQTANEGLREALSSIKNDIANGLTLHEAFAKHPRIFDKTYVNLLRVGETSGKLDQVLARISTFSEERVENEERVKSATLYPKIVLVAFVLAFFGIVYFVIPKIKKFFEQFNAELPLPTRMALGISDLFVHRWYIVLIGGAAAYYVFRRFRETAAGREMLDRYLLKIPVAGTLFYEMETKAFCSTLELLLAGGIPLLEALRLTRDSLKNVLFQRQVDDCVRRVDNGGRMSEVMSERKVFPVLLTGLVAVGEETGELDRVLGQVGGYYQSQINHKLANLTKTLEPILLFSIFGGVLLLALAVYLPLWKMSVVLKK